MISLTFATAPASLASTRVINPSKSARPAINHYAAHAVHVPPRSMNNSSSSRPARFVKFASGGEGPTSGSSMPFDMSTSGKASSNEGQMEGKMNMQEQQQSDTPVNPNPEAASMADKNIAPDSGSMAEQRSSMNVQDRAPATDISAGEQSAPMADKIAEGLQQVAEGSAAGQQVEEEEKWAAQQARMSPPVDKTEGRASTDFGSELGKGRL